MREQTPTEVLSPRDPQSRTLKGFLKADEFMRFAYFKESL